MRRAAANDDRQVAAHATASNLSKVTPPTPHRVHPSERLFQRLDAAAAPVLWIHGPPGSGKTTLAASYLAAKAIRPLWYRLDEGDADPATLFHYLDAAWEGRQAGLRLPQLAAGATLPLFTRRFFRDLFGCPRTKVVVFDDYHEIAADSAVHACLAHGLEEVPAGRRVIVVSRTAPPSSLARLRVNGLIEVIEPDALRMTLDEAEGLVRERGADLASAHIEAMLRRAQGWTAGLILMVEMGAEVPAEATGVSDVLFDYFAGEILQRMSPERQRLLYLLALMPAMSVATVERSTGSGDAIALLEDLRKRNYFTTRDVAEASYRFHPLFRDFLLTGGRERLPPHELAAARLRAAEALQDSGNPEAAVSLLADADAFEALAALIKRQAKTLLDEGRNATLIGWLATLPQTVLDADAWLNYWAGVARIYQAPAKAIAFLRIAARLFEADRLVIGLYLAWAAEADAVRADAYGDVARMDELIDRLHALLARYPDIPPGAVALKVAVCTAIALSRRSNDRDVIAKWKDRAFAAAREVPGDRWSEMLGHIFTIPTVHDADYATARRYLGDRPDDASLGAEGTEMSRYIAPAIMLLYRQTDGDCAAFVERAIQAMEQAGYLAWANTMAGMAAADIYRRGGDPAAARGWLARMGDYDDRYATGRGSFYYAIAAQVEIMAGNLPLARRHAKTAVELGVKQGWHFYTGIARMAKLAARIEGGDLAEAKAELAEMRRLMESSATRVFGMSAKLYAADIAFAEGDEAAGEKALAGAFALAREQGDRSASCSAATTGRLCAKALALGIEPDFVRDFIRASGIPAPHPFNEAWPWPLAIRTLGGFAVMREGRPLAFSRKTPKRLITLLKAIVSYGGRDVPEERLIDAVWPDEDGDAALSALRIATHRLRKLLGDTSVITVKAGRVGLDPARCWLDLWSFEHHAARRQPTETDAGHRERLARAAALYRGDFLAGDEDLWWAEPRRERCRRAMAQLSATADGCL